MKVAFITSQQAEELMGHPYDGVQIFMPVQDINDNWCLNAEEILASTNEDFLWVKNLTADQDFIPQQINI